PAGTGGRRGAPSTGSNGPSAAGGAWSSSCTHTESMPAAASARTVTTSVSGAGVVRDRTVVLLSDSASVGGAGRGRSVRQPAARHQPQAARTRFTGLRTWAHAFPGTP